MIPEIIYLPQFAAPVALFVSRGTTLSAVLLLCLLGCLRPARWQLAGFSIVAAVLFVFLYQDTGRLNRIEASAQQLLNALPNGSRIIATVGAPPNSRIGLGHIFDRACVGHCYTYSDYEPSSGQFWIHSRPGSRTAESSQQDSGNMEFGRYRVKASDLPLKQVYQCRIEDVGQLCIRDLHAGEVNCPDCNNPAYWLMQSNKTRH